MWWNHHEIPWKTTKSPESQRFRVQSSGKPSAACPGPSRTHAPQSLRKSLPLWDLQWESAKNRGDLKMVKQYWKGYNNPIPRILNIPYVVSIMCKSPTKPWFLWGVILGRRDEWNEESYLYDLGQSEMVVGHVIPQLRAVQQGNWWLIRGCNEVYDFQTNPNWGPKQNQKSIILWQLKGTKVDQIRIRGELLLFWWL